MPLAVASEAASGVFERRFDAGVVALDCNLFEATFPPAAVEATARPQRDIASSSRPNPNHNDKVKHVCKVVTTYLTRRDTPARSLLQPVSCRFARAKHCSR